jgi:hypothetical protein
MASHFSCTEHFWVSNNILQIMQSFKLEKSSGKISYMLSARELSISWSDDPMRWSWRSIPESRLLIFSCSLKSPGMPFLLNRLIGLAFNFFQLIFRRFSQVAELRTTDWLEIRGKMKTKILSANTTYGAYLVMKIYDRAYGLDPIPSEISVAVGDQISRGTAYLRSRGDGKKQQMESLFYRNRRETLRNRVKEEEEGDGRVPSERGDGWMEIELGEFFNGEASDQEVKMSLMEIKGYQLKGGLVIEGIEVRPKD